MTGGGSASGTQKGKKNVGIVGSMGTCLRCVPNLRVKRFVEGEFWNEVCDINVELDCKVLERMFS